jgi:hypothetical protein
MVETHLKASACGRKTCAGKRGKKIPRENQGGYKEDVTLIELGPQTYYTIDGLYLRYAAARRQREREVIRAVKLLKQNQSTEM